MGITDIDIGPPPLPPRPLAPSLSFTWDQWFFIVKDAMKNLIFWGRADLSRLQGKGKESVLAGTSGTRTHNFRSRARVYNH